MDDNEQAVLNWVNTFAPEEPVESIIDLADGFLLSTILHKIAGEYFSVVNKDANNEWATRAGNMELILLAMKEYYRVELNTDLDINAIDIRDMTRDYNPDEMFNVLELVIGIAVQCPTKSYFIRTIFSLDLVSQTVLKSMIENVLSGNHPCINGAATALSSNANEQTTEQLLRSQEMVKHLQAERQRLMEAISVLSLNNTSLSEQNEEFKKKLSEFENDTGNDGASAQKGISTAAQFEIDSLKQDLDQKNIEITELQDELYAVNQKYSTTKDALEKAESTISLMTDEVDVARDKAARLIKAENTIEKYQKRLEEFSSLRKINQELEQKIDEYLDRIHELEDAAKNMNALNKVGEQYKDKAYEEERLRLESLSALQAKDKELAELKAELKKAIESRHLMEVELANARMLLDQMSEDNDDDGPMTISSLKEKIRRLEFQLKQAQAGANGNGDYLAVLNELALARKKIAEYESGLPRGSTDEELKKANERIEYLEGQLRNGSSPLNGEELPEDDDGNGSSSIASLKDKIKRLEFQLRQLKGLKENANDGSQNFELEKAQNLVKLLEEQLRERGETIELLTLEKDEAETHGRRALERFKEKYIGIFWAMKDERKDLEQRLTTISSRNERHKEAYNREERLMVSAIYNLGVKSMEHIIAQKKML